MHVRVLVLREVEDDLRQVEVVEDQVDDLRHLEVFQIPQPVKKQMDVLQRLPMEENFGLVQ